MGRAVEKAVLQQQQPEHGNSAAENRHVSGVCAQRKAFPSYRHQK